MKTAKTQKDYVAELNEIKDMQGWNDVELAARMGTTSAMISKWRTGKSNMTSKSKNKVLALSLSLATEKMLNSASEYDKNSNHSSLESSCCYLDKCPAEPPVDRLLQYILESWNTLSSDAKGKIVSIVDEDKKDTTSKVG